MNTTFEVPNSHEFKRRIDWPVDIGIAAGCILGYVFAWIGLVGYFHPIHWVAGISGAVAGGAVGWVWFQLVVKHHASAHPAR